MNIQDMHTNQLGDGIDNITAISIGPQSAAQAAVSMIKGGG